MLLEDELQAVNDAFNSAIDRGDAVAAAEQFTADAVCTAPNTPVIQGSAQLIEWFQSWIDAGLKNSRDNNFIAERQGDIAHMTCCYSTENHGQGSGFVIEHGKALQVFKRDDDGTWKIHRFGLSIDFEE